MVVASELECGLVVIIGVQGSLDVLHMMLHICVFLRHPVVHWRVESAEVHGKAREVCRNLDRTDLEVLGFG